ncbi:MAG: cytochrome c oxidase subunit II, partial [Chloroflexi bacterium]|nr:cytochrome c oxidase subunit II [Chloroflexota bacterium]
MPFNRRTPTKLHLFLLALAVALTLAGCGGPYPQSAMDPAGPFAADLQWLFALIVAIATVIFVVVEAVLIYAVFRFRRRPGDGIPVQVHGNMRLEVAWTIAPAVVLALIAIPTVAMTFQTYEPLEKPSMTIKVNGWQWWWEYQYPQEYGNINTANELIIPAGETIALGLESRDVIHSYWVPPLGGKRDVHPGHVNPLWLKADRPGEYYGQCAEFCGDSHAYMRLRVIALSRPDFDAWVQRMTRPAANPVGAAGQGAQLFQSKGCVGCHTIAGTQAQGKVAPNLTLFGERRTIAAAMMPNTPENLRKWLKNPPGVKPGAKMPN